MSGRVARGLQVAAACLIVAAFAGLSHYCNSVPGAGDFGAALALTPVTVVALALTWRGTPRPIAALLTVGLAGVFYASWPFLRQHFPLVSLVQESAVYALLGLTFGRSLLPDQVALCTRLADKVHGPLTPREVWYTRRVTAAWALYFVAIAAISIGLYAYAPLRLWSFYINFCVLPLLGAMFVGEYLVRRRLLPRGHRAGLLATVRVYFTAPQ